MVRARLAALCLLVGSALPGSVVADAGPPDRDHLHQVVYCSGLFTGLADEAERRGLDGGAQERAATALRSVWRSPVQRGLYDIETAQYAFSMGRNAVVELNGRGDSEKLDALVANCRTLAAEIPSAQEAMEAESDGGAARGGATPEPARTTASGKPERPIVEQEGDQVYLNLGGKVDVDRAAEELEEKIETMPPTPVGP